jgi:hypothetical protein
MTKEIACTSYCVDIDDSVVYVLLQVCDEQEAKSKYNLILSHSITVAKDAYFSGYYSKKYLYAHWYKNMFILLN